MQSNTGSLFFFSDQTLHTDFILKNRESLTIWYFVTTSWKMDMTCTKYFALNVYNMLNNVGHSF